MAAEGASSERKKSRRLSGEPALHEDHFPPLTQFNPPDKLPSMASVIGRLRNLSGGGRSNMSSHKAVLEVAKEVEAKYFHDTIYCKSFTTITKRIEEMWTNFQEGKKFAKAGRVHLTKAKAYIELIKKKDMLFDVYSDDILRRQFLEEEWGVKMGEMERLYLEDQRGPRLMSCDHGVDPIYYRAFMKVMRLRERDKEYKARREEEFRGMNEDQISQRLESQGEFPSPSPESSDTPIKSSTCTSSTPLVTMEEDVGGDGSRKRRRLFQEEEKEQGSSDLLPL